MKIVIAGGSGFLGRALTAHLLDDGDDVVVLGRGARNRITHPRLRAVTWTPDGTAGPWARELDGAGALINLAGAGIADRRWSAARKRDIRDSRVFATRSLVAAVRQAATPPPVVIQGSAIGYYGAFDDGPELDERASPGTDFLGATCAQWEAEAQPLTAAGCRVVYLRTGIVLSRSGGALAKMMPPFQFFVGGPLGSGRQVMSWIHLDDWIALVRWAIGNPAVSGPLNATAPHPATNREFSRALGRALWRPSLFPVPGFVLRLIVGEFARDGLLRGQRVVPRRARELGFTFRFERLDEAIRDAVKRK